MLYIKGHVDFLLMPFMDCYLYSCIAFLKSPLYTSSSLSNWYPFISFPFLMYSVTPTLPLFSSKLYFTLIISEDIGITYLKLWSIIPSLVAELLPITQ